MATDYPVRILLKRLQDTINDLIDRIATISDNSANVLVTASTVAQMQALTSAPKFVRCSNYAGTDGYISLWITGGSGPANGSDVLQSTTNPALFFERIYVKEP